MHLYNQVVDDRRMLLHNGNDGKGFDWDNFALIIDLYSAGSMDFVTRLTLSHNKLRCKKTCINIVQMYPWSFLFPPTQLQSYSYPLCLNYSYTIHNRKSGKSGNSYLVQQPTRGASNGSFIITKITYS